MRIVHGLEQLGPPGGAVVMTVGNFDGLHVGHQAIIREVVARAERSGWVSVVMTFEPHPLRVLAPERAPAILTPLEAVLGEIETLGVDTAVVVPCTRELLGLAPEAFIREVLIKHFVVKVIVEGPNFRFGRGRAGTIDCLITRGPEFGFEAVKVDPVEIDVPGLGRKMVSSSLVRELLYDGRVDSAGRCLGRPYRLCGQVVPGVGRGGTMGFPTANLTIDDQLVPGSGVYAAWAEIDGRDRPCAAHIGPAATFDQAEVGVEAYVIGFEGDLYGRRMTLTFVERLRATRKFDRPCDLVAQVKTDVSQVRRILAERNER